MSSPLNGNDKNVLLLDVIISSCIKTVWRLQRLSSGQNVEKLNLQMIKATILALSTDEKHLYLGKLISKMQP